MTDKIILCQKFFITLCIKMIDNGKSNTISVKYMIVLVFVHSGFKQNIYYRFLVLDIFLQPDQFQLN